MLRELHARKSYLVCVSQPQFLDRSQIKAVVVNETMTFADVVYYLAVMLDGYENMVLPFEVSHIVGNALNQDGSSPCLRLLFMKEFRPRVTVLQEILTKTQSILFPDQQSMQFPVAMGIAN